MKKLSIITIAILFTFYINAQNVYIPDANFKSALVNHNPVIDNNGDGEIQNGEAMTYNGTIEVSSKNISDMTGIEEFVNITMLYCLYNNITTLDLSNNVDLTTVFCANNQLSTLDVSNCSELEVLECEVNQLTSLDISNNNKINILHCNSNQIDTIIIGNASLLTVLYCSANQIANLDITNCTSLTDLDCSENLLHKLDIINNTSLEHLSCSYNYLDSLKLDNLLNLSFLYCYNNQLTNLDLSQNPIGEIWCHDNQLQSLNLKNGNNSVIYDFLFRTYNNPNLFCIEVDDPNYSTTNWINYIDPQSYFSNDCTNNNGEQLDNLNFFIYPNPTTGKIIIQAEEMESVEVYNLQGQIISKKSEVGRPISELDLSKEPKGIYIIKVTTEKGVAIEKVVLD